MKPISLQQLIAAERKLGYTVFEAPDKPYNLNIVGIRSNNPQPNKFDDQMWVYWKERSGHWQIMILPITTDPGTYWLNHPMSPLGTAILKPGQYIGLWKIGTHKTYEALVQKAPCTVIRDYNRDGIADYNSGREESGIFGINFHHAGEDSATVDKFSAGCQVAKRKSEFLEVMEWARMARNYHGNTMTYSLLLENQI